MRQHDQQTNDEQPDVVKSEPVPVPPRDRDNNVPGEEAQSRMENVEHDRTEDAEPTRYHEPAPQPTAFGAATAGGAVAAAALADDRRSTEHDVDEVDTDRSRDGAVADRTAADRDGGFVGQHARTDDDRDAGGTAVAADITAGTTPGDIPNESVSVLLAADATEGFRNRWREVRLRFVDDPRSAVDDARQLVDEAINSVTAALTEQQDRLGAWRAGDSTDTEELRVAVHRYRNFLDRLLGM